MPKQSLGTREKHVRCRANLAFECLPFESGRRRAGPREKVGNRVRAPGRLTAERRLSAVVPNATFYSGDLAVTNSDDRYVSSPATLN